MSKARGSTQRIVNKRAAFEYHLFDRVEAGIELKGTEVKSLRAGQVSLAEAYARIRDDQAELVGCQIEPYSHATVFNHDPKRARRLLLHRREIHRLYGKVKEQGFTLVPLSIYFNDHGRAKVELALAKGKTHRDKRADLRAKDDRREMDRARRTRG
ncbi:MAG: SsrA-binding protein SmpB [Phycisphaerae bacterium]